MEDVESSEFHDVALCHRGTKTRIILKRLFTIAVIGILILLVIILVRPFHKSRFEVIGDGYRFNFITSSFSPSERAKVDQLIISKLAARGVTLTPQEMMNLSNVKTVQDVRKFNTLEDESENPTAFVIGLGNIALMVDPTFKSASSAVGRAKTSSMQFQNQQDRENVFRLLSKFFTIAKLPFDTPMGSMTDSKLISTFLGRADIVTTASSNKRLS